MPRSIVAGNWKMHGSRTSVRELVTSIQAGLDCVGPQVDVVVCPAFIHIPEVCRVLGGGRIAVGAQNVADQDLGAFTGEVSAGMLKEYGCRYVIVGHSERRHVYGETNDLVARRFMAAERNGLLPILCVGETLEQREAGETEAVVKCQIGALLDCEGIAVFSDALIAYEPVWAIGTGRAATPEQAQEVHGIIRDFLGAADAAIAAELPILYGGSVKPSNAEALFSMPDINGGLIGGASLKADEFIAICASLQH